MLNPKDKKLAEKLLGFPLKFASTTKTQGVQQPMEAHSTALKEVRNTLLRLINILWGVSLKLPMLPMEDRSLYVSETGEVLKSMGEYLTYLSGDLKPSKGLKKE